MPLRTLGSHVSATYTKTKYQKQKKNDLDETSNNTKKIQKSVADTRVSNVRGAGPRRRMRIKRFAPKWLEGAYHNVCMYMYMYASHGRKIKYMQRDCLALR